MLQTATLRHPASCLLCDIRANRHYVQSVSDSAYCCCPAKQGIALQLRAVVLTRPPVPFNSDATTLLIKSRDEVMRTAKAPNTNVTHIPRVKPSLNVLLVSDNAITRLESNHRPTRTLTSAHLYPMTSSLRLEMPSSPRCNGDMDAHACRTMCLDAMSPQLTACLPPSLPALRTRKSNANPGHSS